MPAVTGTDAARRYDAWFERGWGAYAFAVERRALLDAAQPLAGRQVLEIGCGTGRFTAALETAGAAVTALDSDPGMLAVAAERTSARLVRADAHTLPLPDDAVDDAITVTTTEFFADPHAALAEAARVTRPGGRLIVATLNPASPWGLAHRRRFRQPPWDDACLRTPRELDTLLAPHGRVARRRAALYAPGHVPGLRRWGPLLEGLRRLAPSLGAFQVRVLEPGG